MSHLTNGRKYAGDFTFNESGAVRHQPNMHQTAKKRFSAKQKIAEEV